MSQPFKHPADAMRAKIQGRLNCGQCTKYDTFDPNWCLLRKHVPRPNALLGEQFCEEFRLRKRVHEVNNAWDPTGTKWEYRHD